MTTALVTGRQPPQLNEFEAQRLNVRDAAVQRGAVGHPTHQDGVSAPVNRRQQLQRLQQTGQRGREPARDPKSVVSVHVGLPFGGIACAPMVGPSG
jgi:hypothetical protein